MIVIAVSLWQVLLNDGVGSEVIAGTVGVVSGEICIVVGHTRTCHNGDGRRRHHCGR